MKIKKINNDHLTKVVSMSGADSSAVAGVLIGNSAEVNMPESTQHAPSFCVHYSYERRISTFILDGFPFRSRRKHLARVLNFGPCLSAFLTSEAPAALCFGETPSWKAVDSYRLSRKPTQATECKGRNKGLRLRALYMSLCFIRCAPLFCAGVLSTQITQKLYTQREFLMRFTAAE